MLGIGQNLNVTEISFFIAKRGTKTTFIGQSTPNIQKKLQKVEGALGMPMSQLVEIAFFLMAETRFGRKGNNRDGNDSPFCWRLP